MKLVVGNQKAYLLREEVIEFIEKTKSKYCKDAVICPSLPYLELYKDSKYILGSQNVSVSESGNTTGETSARQLKSCGISYSIVAHSERRAGQLENASMFLAKIKELLNNDITPIYCVGEGRSEKSEGVTKDFVGKEIMEVFDNMKKEDIERVIVAYEPIWAISGGDMPSITPTNDEISDVVSYIKDLIKDKYDANIPVLYGGSVNKNNIVSLNEIEVVDGYLIGGASTKPDEFLFIMENCLK